MKDIKRKCNSMVNLSKFISNKKTLSGIVVLGYNQVRCQILSLFSHMNFLIDHVTCLSNTHKKSY